MDSELLRTFLEVNRTRHFGQAAERLSVTPAAISARVRLLEERLGARLFTRSRNNIGLTAAGQRLVPHAENVLRGWSQALLSVGTTGTAGELLSLGCVPSIWRTLLRHWLPRLYDVLPSARLQVELLNSAALVPRVREQSLDLAVLYEPPQVSDLKAERLAAIELVMVSSHPDVRITDPLPDYVYVDWGSAFNLAQTRAVPRPADPLLRVDSPDLARDFLLARGGTAYLPRLSVAPDLRRNALHPVTGAPVIERNLFLIQSTGTPDSALITGVRRHLLDTLAAAPDNLGG